MPVNRRKRNRKFRGSMTHGWGAKKKHRGSGNRGGFGMAGTGKRADQKKPSIINEFGLDKYFGKHGFLTHTLHKKIRTINIGYINDNLDSLTSSNKVKKEKDHYTLNLSELGYDKMLGSGKISKRFKITAKSFSKNAVQKIEAAGGEAIIAGKKE